MKHWRLEAIREPLAALSGRRLRKPAVAALAAVVLAGAVYGFGLLPTQARLEGARVRIAEIKRRHADALLFEKQKQVLAGLNKGMLAQKDVPLLVKDLVQMARKRGLSVGTINSDIPTPASSGLTLVTFTVPLVGDYSSLKRYIYEVETADRLVGIQDLKLAAEKNRVKLDLRLVTYIRGE